MDRYGGGKRRVDAVGEAAHRHESGRDSVELRWVGVRYRTGTHRDEFLYSTDPTLTPGGDRGLMLRPVEHRTTF